MYVITGATGRVGGQVAHALLKRGLPVRVVVRDVAKARTLVEDGCEVVVSAMDDELALSHAFTGAEAVFVLLPPTFDPSSDYRESKANVHALAGALQRSAPTRVVALSTVGAQAEQENLLSQLQYMEREFAKLPMSVAFLRAAWFIENISWDIESARSSGILSSFLQPLDKLIPMVGTADVATTAASLMQQSWDGHRVVELEGPERLSPEHLAATLGKVLGRGVSAVGVPRSAWEALFRNQGMVNPGPRMRMLDGFNEGWIRFEGIPLAGTTSLETVLHKLIQEAAHG